MAIKITPSSKKFIEASSNDGTIANSVTLRLEGATFKGANGDALLGAVEGVPAGLTAVLIRTSATTAKLSLTGKAANHLNQHDTSASTLRLTLTDTHVTAKNPVDWDGNGLTVSGFSFDFNDAATVGTLVINAPVGTAFNRDSLPKELTGAATGANAQVYIFNGKKQLGMATVDANGLWKFTLPTDLKAGVMELTAKESTDGKTFGPPSAAVTFTLDTKPPSAPVVNTIKLPTSDTTPTLSGKAEKGATVTVFVDGKALGTTTAHAQTGNWTLTVADDNALEEGLDAKEYKLTAIAQDAAGNQSEPSKKAVILTVDTTTADPTITTGIEYRGQTKFAKTTTQKLEGKAEIGATVQLYGGQDGSVALGDAIKVGKNGSWKASLKLAEGKHLLSAVATDAAGNVSAPTDIGEVHADTIAPGVPTLALAEGETTGKTLPTLTGKAEKGATVEVKIGRDAVGTTVANDQGNWTLDTSGFATTLKDGKYKLTAIATDGAGNASKASEQVEFNINSKLLDSAAPRLVAAETNADGSKIILFYSQALDATTAGAVSTAAFAVTVGGNPQTVNTASIQGARVELTLATPVAVGDAITVSYTIPTGINAALIQDKAGNDASSLNAREVLNKVPAAGGVGDGGGEPGDGGGNEPGPPTLVEAKTSLSGDAVVLVFNEALSTTTAQATDFVVKVGADAIEVKSVQVAGNTVTLALQSVISQDVYYRDQYDVTVDYTPGTADPIPSNLAIQDTEGNDAEGFTGKPVVNAIAFPTLTEIIVGKDTLTVTSDQDVQAQLVSRESGSTLSSVYDLTANVPKELKLEPQDTVQAVDLMLITPVLGSDVLYNVVTLGTAGNDTIDESSGKTIFTFDGKDVLQFKAISISANIVTRVIPDFESGSDKIEVFKKNTYSFSSAFDALAGNGSLAPGEFVVKTKVGEKSASTPEGRIVYNSTDGKLYYDPDGNKTVGDAVLIATLVGSPTLVATDFIVNDGSLL